MKLQDLAELGYLCGVKDLDQALAYAELHWDAFSAAQWKELQEDLVKQGVNLSTPCIDFLGALHCRALDRELCAAMASVPEETFEEFQCKPSS